MSEINLWKLAERMEQLMDHIDEINEYLDRVHETNIAYSDWIQIATESLVNLQKDINFIKNKKTCI